MDKFWRKFWTGVCIFEIATFVLDIVVYGYKDERFFYLTGILFVMGILGLLIRDKIAPKKKVWIISKMVINTRNEI